LIVEIVQIPALAFKKVHFYSVRLEGRVNSEFRDFQLRMNQKGNQIELAEINRHIENIGKRFGAYPKQFRDEGAADGLPPPYHEFLESDDPDDYGLRLYCIRLSPSVVILLNGDRKTNLKARLCDNCKPHFEKANALAGKITQAILDGYMEIDEDEKEIQIEEDFELTI
jgi:hypothetical protein